MSIGSYRIVLVGCVLAWFMLGLHVPALHGIGHGGHGVPSLVIALSALFAILGVAGLWVLFRARVTSDRNR